MAGKHAAANIKQIAKRYANALQNEIGITTLYLYGSYANGTNHKDSDIDIAVISDQFSGDVVDDMLKLMRLRRNIDFRIEPHPFLPEDFTPANPIANEIIQTGIRII
jgi:uncharacterized protein